MKIIEYWIAKKICKKSVFFCAQIQSILFSPSEQNLIAESLKLGDLEKEFLESLQSYQLNSTILARFFEYKLNSIKTSSNHKKNHGAFYTPDYIIQEILHNTIEKTFCEKFGSIWPEFKELIKNSFTEIQDYSFSELQIEQIIQILQHFRIIDNSCGCGDFLVSLTQKLFPIMQRIFYYVTKNKVPTQFSNQNIVSNKIWTEFQTDSHWIHFIFRFMFKYNIFGIEIEPMAIQITQIRLLLEYYNAISNNEESTFSNHAFFTFNLQNLSGLTNTSIFFSPKDQFTVIIGNPPYGNILDPEEKHQLVDFKLGFTKDIASLFVEQSLRTLEMGGRLAYVLPKSIAFYSQWEKVRTEILKYRLEKVIDLGMAFENVNAEQIVVILHKDPIRHSKDFQIEIAQAKPLRKIEIKKTIQNLGKNSQSLLQLHNKILFKPLSDLEEALIAHVQSHSVKFRSIYHSVFRGIYISDQEKSALKSGTTLWINRIPDIQRFRIKKCQALDLSLIKSENSKKWNQLTVPRLFFKVLRGKRLTCYIDPTGEIVTTEKLVNVTLPKESKYDLFALFVILNSKFPSYYLEKMLFSEDTETSRVLDEPYMGEIPLPHTLQSQKLLIQLAYCLLILSATETNCTKYSSLIQEIETEIVNPLIYWEYIKEELDQIKWDFASFWTQFQSNGIIDKDTFITWWMKYLAFLKNPQDWEVFETNSKRIIDDALNEIAWIQKTFHTIKIREITNQHPWIREIEKLFNTERSNNPKE